MWPSLITDADEKMMVSQGLRKFFIEGGAYGTEWPLVMAGSTLIVLPLLILFAFTQKWFINGIGGDTGMNDKDSRWKNSVGSLVFRGKNSSQCISGHCRCIQ